MMGLSAGGLYAGQEKVVRRQTSFGRMKIFT